MNEVREYAMRLLVNEGCDLDCYSDENYAKDAERDLVEYEKEHGKMPYSIKEVANALIKIGNQQPKKVVMEAPYMFCWETQTTTDGFGKDSYEIAKAAVIDDLLGSIAIEIQDWEFDENGIPHPTEEQIEHWNYMICNCGAWVEKWNPVTQEYEEFDGSYLTDWEYREIGWELWEDLNKASSAPAV